MTRSALKRPPLFVSYAGNLEDVLLSRLFPGNAGFYVDVGASDPVISSNTWALYQRGWDGIVVDPSVGVCEKLRSVRPRDICLNIALGEADGQTSFFQFGNGDGHSTCDRGRAEELRSDLSQAPTEFSVPVRTLGSVLAEHARDRTIDVLSIDAEGAEAAILRGAQLDRFRPKVILIEAMAAFIQMDVSEAATALLEQNGYVLGYEDGLNKFFVAKEHPALLEDLRYPPSLFDNYITAREHGTRQKSRRRLRLLQLTIAGWAASAIALAGYFLIP